LATGPSDGSAVAFEQELAGPDAALCRAVGGVPVVTPTSSFTWLTQQDRSRLGLRSGPDSLVAHLIDSSGTRRIFFSGTRATDAAVVGGGTFRLDVLPDGGLAPDPEAPGGSVTEVLEPGALGDPTPGIPPNGGDGGIYSGYDRDYSGGGTAYACPSGVRIQYFFHAENHTDPFTGERHRNALQGWTGLGQARWDDATQRLVKQQQIIGLHLTNTWANPSDASTEQAPPASGSGNVVFNPEDGYLYLFYNDRSDEPEYAAGSFRCATTACVAVARAKPVDVCTNAPNPWKKYYHGDFTEPGVYDEAQTSVAYPPGTGGKFTPLFAGAAPTPKALRIAGVWVMVARGPAGTLTLRTAKDFVTWSDPTTIATGADGYDVLYPNLLTDFFDATTCGPWVVTYTQLSQTQQWQDATVRAQRLEVRW
jgi:hypothetical protein